MTVIKRILINGILYTLGMFAWNYLVMDQMQGKTLIASMGAGITFSIIMYFYFKREERRRNSNL